MMNVSKPGNSGKGFFINFSRPKNRRLDVFKTIAGESTGEYSDRGSKFMAVAAPVANEVEAGNRIEREKKIHKKSRHHCFAWRLGTDGNQFRANDDGEPSGTAGYPILGQIDHHGLTNVLVVVSRYFGGTLLGTSGLINAYRGAASIALKNASVIEKTIDATYDVEVPYDLLNNLTGYIKRKLIDVSYEQYKAEKAFLQIRVRLSKTSALEDYLNSLDGIVFSRLN